MTTETSIYEYARQGLALSAEKTALWFYGRSMTYRELFDRIDNVADHLYTLGVRQGTVVTIHLPNCPQAVMAIYAVAKLGGICNLVHPLTPLNVLHDNMLFAESDVLITGSHFSEVSAVDFAKTVIYARAYVQLADGTYIYGDTVACKLQTVIETIDAKQWGVLNEIQKTALIEMYATYSDVMATWNIPNLKNA
jgi:acyl-CoA synthetase (AMP-forming)/AMP-acid ligase II